MTPQKYVQSLALEYTAEYQAPPDAAWAITLQRGQTAYDFLYFPRGDAGDAGNQPKRPALTDVLYSLLLAAVIDNFTAHCLRKLGVDVAKAHKIFRDY